MSYTKYQYTRWRAIIYYVADSHLPLTIAFISAISYSFLYHMWLLKIPGLYSWSFDFGIWAAVIIEGFIVGTIIYYVTILLPLKRKKIHVLVMLQNKLSYLYLNVRELFEHFGYPIADGFHKPKSEVELSTKLLMTKNQSAIFLGHQNIQFSSLTEYMFARLDEIRSIIHELYLFQDLLDSEILLELGVVENSIGHMNRQRRMANSFENLHPFYHMLFNIFDSAERANQLFETKNDLAMAIYMQQFRKRTIKKLQSYSDNEIADD